MNTSLILVDKIRAGARYAKELSSKNPGLYFTIRVVPEGFMVDGRNVRTEQTKNIYASYHAVEMGNTNLLIHCLMHARDALTGADDSSV